MRLYEYVFELQDRVTKTMEKISNGQTSMMRQFQRTQKAGTEAYNGVRHAAVGYEGVLNRIKRLTVGLFATGALVMATNDLVAVTARFQAYENAINFASGASSEAAKNQEFLQNTIDKYKLPLEASTSGFKQLTASMMGTKLQGQATRDIFEGVSVAATAMNLTGEQVNGTYLALGQIMSKGKVQAEELRGQLGERLPGAFLIAARAMGVTQAELNKLLETGEVYSEDFLPKFAAELKRTFEKALPDALLSLQSSRNAYETEVTRMKVLLGNELLPAMASFYETMGEGLRELNPLLISSGQSLNAYLVANRENFLGVLKSGVGFLKFLADHRQEITFLIKAYVTYKAAVIGYNLAIKATTFLLGAYQVVLRTVGTLSLIAATGIKTARDAMAAFNLVVGANPLGALAAVLAAAGTAFLLFRNKMKQSNDEFERFNRLQEDFKNNQASIADSERLFQNLNKLNQRQREGLASQLESQRNNVEDQLLQNRLSVQGVDIEDLRARYRRVRGDGSAKPTPMAIELDRQIRNYETATNQINQLTKSFDQLSNRLNVVNGFVRAGQNAPGGTDPVNPQPDAQTQQSLDGIIAGGKKVTHVTLNIDTINGIGEVISTTVGENLDDIGDKILEVVTRALNGATQTIGN